MFTVREYLGFEVYKPEALSQPLREVSDIQEGSQIVVNNVLMRVSSEKGAWVARSGRLAAILMFRNDDRKCWTSVGMVNLDAVRQLSLRA